MKKTIIYTGPFIMPDKNAAAHRVLSNAKVFRKLGYDVVFAGISADADTDFEKTLFNHEGFDMYEIRCGSAFDKMKKLTKCVELKKVIEKYDACAVVAYDYYATGLYAIRKICKKRGIKFFADSDEWFGFTGSSFTDKLIRWADSQLRMRIMLPKTDGLIVISSFLYNYYKDKTNTVCVPPLTDMTEEKWEITPAESESRGLQFAYAGSPGRSKDKINKIIECLALHSEKDFTFRVVGISKEQYLKYYPEHTEIIEKLGEKVDFKGRQPHKIALDYIKSADFMMFYREITRVTMAGFPTKFVEGVSSGTPIITNQTSDLKMYLKDGVNSIVIDGCKDEDIAQAFDRVFSMSKESIEEMKNVCLAQRNIFHYENYVDEIGKLF